MAGGLWSLPPVAVRVDLPQVVGHYEEGQEVILTFHAIPEWMEGQLGFALQAMGWQMERLRDLIERVHTDGFRKASQSEINAIFAEAEEQDRSASATSA